jgi:2-keto-4-pentenoate hydratase/2-oxohepta-3-ene-1,7-dioic acid hydratase in catechol pathway
MRLATILQGGLPSVAVVRNGRVLPLAIPGGGFESMRAIAASGEDGLQRIAEWVERQPDDSYRSLEGIDLAPVVPDPGAVYTIGLNYRGSTEPDDDRPERPLVYGKATSSVVGQGAVVSWDRAVTANVDAECELGVVIGAEARAVEPADAMTHVFGYTCINDISSRDPWLDGDQWLLGKSLPGFCPVGPWVVTRDTVREVGELRLGCTVNGEPIQEGSTAQMRFSIPEVIAYLSRHVTLRPGDLIATGTPERLAGPIGPERHLRPGDVVTVWIERIGELTTTIA